MSSDIWSFDMGYLGYFRTCWPVMVWNRMVQSRDGTVCDCMAWDGMAGDVMAWDGMEFDGMACDGMTLDCMAWGGMAWDGMD